MTERADIVRDYGHALDVADGNGEAPRDGHDEPDHVAVERLAALDALVATDVRPAGVTLPAELWSSTPMLGHVRRAAHARLVAPDAVLGAVLARIALFSPPSVRLPPIVGAAGSLNVIVNAVGAAGSGKSASHAVAADLVTRDVDYVRDAVPIGSGEGIVDAYLGPAQRGSTTREVRYRAVAFHADEGHALIEQGGRRGSILWPTIRSAWSGAQLGQFNAKVETRRQLAAGTYRFVLTAGWQPRYAAAIVADVAGGGPQRMTWWSAVDPTMPDEPPSWPGPLDSWSPPLDITGGTVLGVPDAIASDVRRQHAAVTRGEQVLDELDAHRNLNRLKLAGLFAVMHGQRAISDEHWQMAGVCLATSDRQRAAALDVARWEVRNEERRGHARAARAAAYLADDEKRRAVEQGAAAVARKAHREPEPISRRVATHAVAGRLRELADLDEIVAHAVGQGWVRELGDTLAPGDSRPA